MREVSKSAFIVTLLTMSVTAAYANLPVRFAVAQEQAGSVILARARAPKDRTLVLIVERTIVGTSVGRELAIQHHERFQGSQIVDGHRYLILLGADGEPFTSYIFAGNLPLLGCGVVNSVEVGADDVLIDAGLYDARYLGKQDKVTVAAVEREFVQSRKEHDGG